jgi:hypothetical protein
VNADPDLSRAIELQVIRVRFDKDVIVFWLYVSGELNTPECSGALFYLA